MEKYVHLVILLIAALFCGAQTPVLYGFTPLGGANGRGTIFKVKGDGTEFKVIYNFTASSGTAQNSLYKASNGLLYGITGTYMTAPGSIFVIDPATDSVTFLSNFNGNNGWTDGTERLTEVGDIFYGVTIGGGGTLNPGVIFKFDTLGNTCTAQYSFASSQLFNPQDKLVPGGGSKLYGVTHNGGTNGLGGIFSLDWSTDSVTTLYNFNGLGACCLPYRAPVFHNGYLYGTTLQGGAFNMGMIYRYNPLTNDMLVVKEMDSVLGQVFSNGIMKCSNGLLYGMTNTSGFNQNFTGAIYTINPANNIVTKVYDFTGNVDTSGGGYIPYGDLTEASDGMLYGMTKYGGRNSAGNIFKFNPVNNTYTNVFDFTVGTATGYQPWGWFVESGAVGTGINKSQPESMRLSISPNPATGDFAVVTINEPVKLKQLELLDMLGSKIKSYIVTSNKLTIETGNLPAGVYLLTTPGETGNTAVGKLLKY